MNIQLEIPRRTLLAVIFADWDGNTPIHTHIEEWQQTENAYRINLLAEALGNYRRHAIINIPPNTLIRWAKKLHIDVPVYDPRRHFVSLLLRDWDRSKPLADHVREWQDLSDPFKYQLITATLGNRFRNRPIPVTTIQQWIRQLNIKVPRSRRTANPSKRTLYRWKANERTRTVEGGTEPPS